jgi:hypothetical protein
MFYFIKKTHILPLHPEALFEAKDCTIKNQRIGDLSIRSISINTKSITHKLGYILTE